MKIALACRIHPFHRPGGMPSVFRDRSHALAAAGHEIHVLTTSISRRGRGSESEDNGVIVHHVPCRREINSAEFAEHCRRHCESWRPDIIHLDSYDPHNLWWQDHPGGAKRTACTLHGFGTGAFLTRWNLYRTRGGPAPQFDAADTKREAEIVSKFDVAIGISLHEHWMLRDMLGVFNAKLVYNPIPGYFFNGQASPYTPTPQDSGARKRRFLCAAISGQDVRGFHIAKEAARLAGVELDVISGVRREDMPAAYDRCDGLVLPTCWGQGFDLTCAESLARLRPVICSAVGSYLRESESGGMCGNCVTVPVGDIDALAAAMRGPLPWVTLAAAWQHKPEIHAQNWLEAVA